MTHTTLTWQRWTDTNDEIGHMAHDFEHLRTYFKLPDLRTAVFPWGKFGELGKADGHSRAIAWGQSSRHIHADDEKAVAENLLWYGGALVCEHLTPSGVTCEACTEAALAELSDEAAAEYEVIRLDHTPRSVIECPDEAGYELTEKLSQLCARYDEAATTFAAAAERLDEVKAGIKATAQLLRPGAKSIRIVSDDLARDLTVVRSTRNTLDSKLIRSLCERAGVEYASLTKPTTTTTLKAVK